MFSEKQTWYFSIRNETWTRGPDMPTGRHGHPCAALKINNTKVVVIGDQSKRVDFLIQNEWISGPSLPDFYYDDAHQLVSNGETLFYINTYDNVFLKMECESINSCMWIEMEQKLQIPRFGAVAKLIPDHLADCTIPPMTSSTPASTSMTSPTTVSTSTPTTSSKGIFLQATFSPILGILVSLIFNKFF